MNLAGLLDGLAPTGLESLALPRHLLGTFRRKSITFHNGLTDETTIVYWMQSASFSIDLRLPDAERTPVTERQGWVGDTLWDEKARLLSWRVDRSYQPRNQWPEPAGLHFIGNSVLEFAPSGAYVEDWRQRSSRGPLLGLRLLGMRNEVTGREVALDGGLLVAGEHMAFAQSRLPHLDDRLQGVASLETAVAENALSPAEVESYEVSVAIGGEVITHSTQPERGGERMWLDGFALAADGAVTQAKLIGGERCVLIYKLDVYAPDFAFGNQTPCTPEARAWMDQERSHLTRHAVLAC